ncbi:MAG: response regulator [Niabella sp.]
MKISKPAFITIIAVLVAILMTLILVTQSFTNRSTAAVRQGNAEALRTFIINNRIQRLANMSFDMQSKFAKRNFTYDSAGRASLTNGLTEYGYNSNLLIDTLQKFIENDYLTHLSQVVNEQLNLSLEILETPNSAKRGALIDSMRTAQFSTNVYEVCLSLQRTLEDNLKKTLISNTEDSRLLSNYNRVLALFAILAIMVLITIIIRHQISQVRLISELQIAEAAALKSKNAKDEFLANMSHELRTPLNSLIGFSNLLAQTNVDKEQKEYLDIIQTNGYNLLNIVNDILDLSKIEAGKLKITLEPFDLRRLMYDVERMFSASVRDKKLYYLWNLDEKIPQRLIGDEGRLKQVLVNIIGNAIKFTTEGGIKVNVGIVWTDDQTGKYKLSFSVKDTGVGIPADKIPTIFERFEQLEQGTTRQHGGTGLGLTIIKDLVERMGGVISVYSEVNAGSEFNFTSMFERVTGEKDNQDSRKVPVKADLSSRRLLLVEDNKSNQVLLKHLLQKYKNKPTFADNGLQAIELLQSSSFDLVLMDIQMPHMDGYAAIKEIKGNPNIKTPVIVMTAYVAEREIKKCFDAGFDDYIPKPIEESMLINKITKFLPDTMQEQANDKTPPEQAQTPPQEPEHESELDVSIGYLETLTDGDPDALEEILTEIKSQWQSDKQEISSAVAANDIVNFKRILHRMKSTFSAFGVQHAIYEHLSRKGQNLINPDKQTINKEQFAAFTKVIDTFVNKVFDALPKK